jgi:hypothetical protein
MKQPSAISAGTLVTIWECALRKKSARLWLVDQLPKLLGDPLLDK